MSKNNKNFGIDFLNEKNSYININEIVQVLALNGTELSIIVKKSLENKVFVLNRQEINYLSSHKKEEWAEYLIYRYKFRNYPNREILEKYPIYIVLEPSSACNLQCIMCFQRDLELKKKSGIMSWDLFKKVIDEMEGGCCQAITIAGRGEPLLNPEICNMLDYLKGKFLEIKINTNGLLMNEEIVRSILRNNVNVVFSAEGSNSEEYEQIRCKGNFELLIQNIKKFNIIRKNEFLSSTTRTRVSGVAFKNINKSQYYNFWKELVDEVVIVEYEVYTAGVFYICDGVVIDCIIRCVVCSVLVITCLCFNLCLLVFVSGCCIVHLNKLCTDILIILVSLIGSAILEKSDVKLLCIVKCLFCRLHLLFKFSKLFFLSCCVFLKLCFACDSFTDQVLESNIVSCLYVLDRLVDSLININDVFICFGIFILHPNVVCD